MPVVPNPAGDHALIRFALPEPGHVRLDVVDVQGRRVAALADGDFGVGPHEVVWNREPSGTPVRGGVYFMRLGALGRVVTRRFVTVH